MPTVNEQSFAMWSPDESPWSVWTKPVMFARIDIDGRGNCDPAFKTGDEAAFPDFASDVAVVVDLPSDDSVRAGLELARRGWRPVPLFNATTGPSPLVNLSDCASLLRIGAEQLAGMTIRPDAPPAFLIDAARMTGLVMPGHYDNRSVVMPQDFPSATFLQSKGIRSVVVMQRRATPIGQDLEHVLLRWKQAGLRLRVISPDRPEMTDLDVKPPSRFRKAWYRIIALVGLRRSNVGGFGGIIPQATSGGYG